jgi:hypothetical protein
MLTDTARLVYVIPALLNLLFVIVLFAVVAWRNKSKVGMLSWILLVVLIAYLIASIFFYRRWYMNH